MHIKRISTFLLILCFSVSLQAQGILSSIAKEVVKEMIKDAIVSSVKESAKGNVNATSNANVVAAATDKAKKRGVSTAARNKNISMENLDLVVKEATQDGKEMLSNSSSEFKRRKMPLYFSSLAGGKSLETAKQIVERTNNISKYGILQWNNLIDSEEKVKILLGKDLGDSALTFFEDWDIDPFLDLLDRDQEFRRAIQLDLGMIIPYLRVKDTPLRNDLHFLNYINGGAHRYINSGVLYWDSINMISVDNLKFVSENGGTKVIDERNVYARIKDGLVSVSDEMAFLNYALLPNTRYEVGDMLYQTDAIGRVVEIKGDVVYNRVKETNRIIRLSFANARMRYSNNINQDYSASYIVPLSYGGVCAGINVVPLIGNGVENQKEFFKSIKKDARDSSVRIKVTLAYQGASEIPNNILYSRED